MGTTKRQQKLRGKYSNLRTVFELGGTSIVITLPKDMLAEIGVKIGDTVILKREKNGIFIKKSALQRH